MQEKKVFVIGNNLMAEILSAILADEFQVIKISNENNDTKTPYYPNDINDGIMKQFLKDAELTDKYESTKPEVLFKIYTDYDEMTYNGGVSNFKQALIRKFPVYSEQIKELFDIFDKIGNEWNNYIKNRFSANASMFKISAKYGMIEMKQIVQKFNLSEEIKDFICALLPKDDVTMSVFGGYLVTQAFDINCMNLSLFDILSDNKRNIDIQVDDINKFECKFVQDEDYIVDCRQRDNVERHGGYSKFWDNTGKMPLNTVMYFKSKSYWFHIWNNSIIQKGDFGWNVEYVFYDDETDVKIIEEKIRIIFDGDVKLYETYEDVEIAKRYGLPIVKGYNWAFNMQETLKDPMNLMRVPKGNVLSCEKWGYAWFSAAYYVRNILVSNTNSK